MRTTNIYGAFREASTRRPFTREPRRITDPDGNRLVHVPLTGGAVAVLDEADFDRVMTLGISKGWFFNKDGKGHAYVKASLPGPGGNLVMVARLIMDVPHGQVVRPADRNPLNLRRGNLAFRVGFSKHREVAVKAGADQSDEGGF